MGESKKARRKRKRKNIARDIRKEEHNRKRRDFAAFAAMRKTGAGAHGQGRPDKEASKTACRKKVDLMVEYEED